MTAGTDQGPATSTRWLVWLAAALVVVFGTRQLFGSGFPVVGQLLPMPSWATLLHRFVSGWQPTGVGTTDPTTPGHRDPRARRHGPVRRRGAAREDRRARVHPRRRHGMARLTRPLGTAWARVTSTVIYLAIPVPYDALATGHWDALVMYAACPWIVHLLGQASRVDPYADGAGARPTGRGPTASRPRPARRGGGVIAPGANGRSAASAPACIDTVGATRTGHAARVRAGPGATR